MASRRLLKKEVKAVTELTARLCFIAGEEAEENKEAFTELLDKAFELQHDIVSRISHTEPGNVKAFYKKLLYDMNTGTKDILIKLYELEA